LIRQISRTPNKRWKELTLFCSLLLISNLADAETKKKAAPYREGEVLGTDSSSEPLPVELVEDPALSPQKIERRSKKIQVLPLQPKPLKDPTLDEPLDEQIDPGDEIAADNSPESIDDESTTTLNVKDVEIAALVKSFSKIAKRNYIVDSNVKGKVTIHLAESVTTDEALRILDSVLLLKGFTTVPVGPNTYKVVPAKDAKKTTIPTLGSDEDSGSDALVTRLIRLKNVAAQDLQASIQQFVSGDGLLTTFAGTNSLIVIDSAANIERVEKLIRELDVPALDQDVTVIPIKYAEAKDVADKVNQILGQDDKSGAQQNGARAALKIPSNTPQTTMPGMPNTPPAPIQSGDAGNSGGRRSLPAKVIADERTNAIIVVADPDTTGKIQALIEQLDSKVDLSGGRFYVMRLKHADADELSDVLNTVLGGGGSGSGGRNNTTSGSSLSRRSRGDSSGGFGQGFGGQLGGSRGARGRLGGGGGSSSGGTGSSGNSGGGGGFTIPVGQGGSSSKVNFEGEVSIASDPATNSLIVNSSRNDYLKIKEVVDMLDIKRQQVLVESTILEVSLDNRESKGIELIGSLATDKAGVLGMNNFGGLTDLLSNPAGLRDLTIAAASSGTITLPTGITIPSQALLINAVSQNQNVNILSNPTVLTTDNQEAEIVVGQNIPIVTSRGTNSVNLDNTFNSIDRQDVGITLRLTPQIGGGDFVTLKMFVEISDVEEGTEGNSNGPTTKVRTSETNVEVKSGQMVITGGLIQDSVATADRGIPYWKEIPILGNLFSQDSERRRRTNLLIFITPRVVSDQFDAREVTADKRNYLEKEIAATDSYPTREELLRSDSIDKVFERGEKLENKPSTITPPKAALSTEEAEAIRAAAREITMKAPEKDLYSVTVKPKLPTNAAPVIADSAKLSPQLKVESARQENTFFVLLKKSGDEGIIGMEVPGSIEGPAAKFFQTGSRVKRRSEAGAVEEFVCLGRFETKDEAAKGPLKPANWRQISVPETLSLGSGPWTK